MPTRQAHARWEGSIKEGNGQVDFGNGAFKAPYSFTSRFENGTGTNPEELLGAAQCELLRDGAVADPRQGGPEARLCGCDRARHGVAANGGFRITKSPLVCEAGVPGIDSAAFMQHANAAKAGCPVSQALAGTEITLDAKLAAAYASTA